MRTGLVSLVLLVTVGAISDSRGAPDEPAGGSLPSEIRRGADAAFGCQIHVRPLDGDALLQCLQDQQRVNQEQMGRRFQAFDAGLWYVGRGRLNALATVAPNRVSKLSVAIAAGRLGEAEMAVGLTDDLVWRAVHPFRERPSPPGPPPAAPPVPSSEQPASPGPS